MIAIIDYGVGNLRSVQKGFEMVGAEAIITSNPEVIDTASSVVLPGVGAFSDAMDNLKNLGLIEVIHSSISSGKPFLGICLGMQLLFTESEEFGHCSGLDIIKGRVVRFQDSTLKVPHMGWNQLNIRKKSPILQDISDKTFTYFVHSYFVVPEDTGVIATTTDYGVEFVSSIWQNNLYAVQFHPEKSQSQGLAMLKAFAGLDVGKL
ncbi:imidazole glycerol phosphate synthase subunit HisH [Candidatus Desantisbacteria bacterium CG2_30_40_21]|uniref:Imidazole glycerol phosphate synthase subunit HisH n=3 Tax=unclassified Candidatus Desantisiibacteriota TaxID=3106372 RepID=A0A2M8AUX7_9BACT|nr:MAG: imidazole glycerol phosphate synthase subunit HisH [Candidatus Desantisbacteria bacterium CG2_30_40_21]PIP42165.1 MAG: imidazole glycerol phosphate synthase subunit HisH [Candidatus Desantisbacteria bacterium CG23_combo_of_CG06-09_8_20_14_all_40_23]PJB30008.1 MAG: imidazole glycerol phosphate synthase subunit HisH [Candidatus Desantisbacteria bacterium CG_4_9_14_3_um_filter_40_11]